MKDNFRLFTEETSNLINLEEGIEDANTLAEIITEVEKSIDPEKDWDKFKAEVVKKATDQGIKQVDGYDVSDALEEAKPKMEADDGEGDEGLIRCPKPPQVESENDQSRIAMFADKDSEEDEEITEANSKFEKDLEKDKEFLKGIDITLEKFKSNPSQIIRSKPEDMVGAVLGRMGANETSGLGRIEDKYDLEYGFWNNSKHSGVISSFIKVISKRLIIGRISLSEV